jgi:transcriptional regulator with XRE-family HTH domain
MNKPLSDAQVGAAIRRVRTAAGMSQQELASAVGTWAPTIGKLEAGTRPLRFTEAVALCAVFGISVNQLIGSDAIDTDDPGAIQRLRIPAQLFALTDQLSAIAGELSAVVDNAMRAG